jgi:hypothetical protein
MVRSPRMRIFVLLGLLLLIIAVMAGLRQYARTPDAKEISRDVPTPVVGPLPPAGIPVFDMEIADRVTDMGPDARRRWPTEAVRYLLLEAANTPAVHAYHKNLLPVTSGSAAEIEKDSRPWRFKYVRFRGELEYIHEEEDGDAPARVTRGRLRVAGTEPPVRVVFVTIDLPEWRDPDEPVAHPETRLIEDGWVRGRGILVKNYVDADEVPALLVVATDIERDFETVPVDSLADVPLDIIDDDPARANTEEGLVILRKEYRRPLYRLIKLAEGRAGGPGAELRAREGLKPERLLTREQWEEVYARPDKFRGRYFGGLGALAMTPLVYVPETIQPNDAGVEECLSVWILTDERKLIWCFGPASLDGDWKKGDRIRWEGYFYKMKLYSAQDGTERNAPVFVLTVLEKMAPPSPSRLTHVLLAGAFILGLGLMIFFIVRDDRTKERYRRVRRRQVAAEPPAD